MAGPADVSQPLFIGIKKISDRLSISRSPGRNGYQKSTFYYMHFRPFGFIFKLPSGFFAASYRSVNRTAMCQAMTG